MNEAAAQRDGPPEGPTMHAEAGGLPEHRRQTGHRLIDLVTAVAAIVISVASLYVAVSHGRTEEKLLAASSWPFLTFASAKDGLEEGGWTIYFRLRNSGVGPARVKWLRLVLDGRPVKDRSDLMARCCGLSNASDDQVQLGFASHNPAIGVLPARETVEILTWRATRQRKNPVEARRCPTSAPSRGLLLLSPRRVLDQQPLERIRPQKS